MTVERSRPFRDEIAHLSLRLATALEQVRQAQSLFQGSPFAQDALLLNLERAAWAMIEMANAVVYELRLGIPRKENESIEILQRNGFLELDEARRYRMLSEHRAFSRREARRIDWEMLSGTLPEDLELFRRWDEQLRGIVDRLPA